MSPTTSALQSGLAARVHERRGELESAALARIQAISDPADVKDPEYAAGLREAVTAGLAYALAAIEAPRRSPPSPEPVPVQLLAQARNAARSGISLDTVLRRYFAGYTLLGDFLVQAADEGSVPASGLQRAMRGEAALFDRLVASVSDEYTREVDGHSHTAQERRADQVRMLLGGELVDTAELHYEFDAWHIGAIAVGPGAQVAIRELAKALGRRLLTVCADDGAIWAWFGGMRRLASRELLLADWSWPGSGVLAFGEPGQGLEGWRLSHRQAKAALLVARVGSERQTAYADVALVAAMLQDEVLAASLPRLYLDPLSAERDGGATFRRTLRAYFAAERNTSSAAADLGVSRRTVANRLHAIEEHLGRSLPSCSAELEAALRLDALGDFQAGKSLGAQFPRMARQI